MVGWPEAKPIAVPPITPTAIGKPPAEGERVDMPRSLPRQAVARNPVYRFRSRLGDLWVLALRRMTFLADRCLFEDAHALIAAHGAAASREAAARAGRSRDLGNVVHFCRWRTVERLIVALADDRVGGTRH